MAVSDNLVHQITTSTGATSLTVSAVSGKQSFNDAFGTGGTDVFWYFITHQTLVEWEVGTGHLSSSTVLVRDTIIDSSNGGSVVTFSAGTKDVASDIPYGQLQLVGKTELYLMAGSFVPQITNGPSRGIVELGTNLQMLDTLDFDTGTQEFASVFIKLPKRWNLGTATFIPHWTAASGSGNVVWALQGSVVSNDDPLNPTWGTEQTSDDTLLTANDDHRGPESSAITFGGTPTAGDGLWLRVKRNVASDSLGVDAKLIGLELYITISAANDA